MLAVVVPTVLMVAVGIVILAVGSSEAASIVAGVLVLTFCTTAITGSILGSIFLGRGASLARLQNDFLSGISHELRTPLTSIGLFIESLGDGRLSREEQTKVLGLLGGEVARLQQLVNRLVELSRMETGAHVFERAPLEVADLVRDAVAAFDAATLARPTPVMIDLEPGLALIGDRATLVRAVSNLLVNSWKYTGDDKQIAVKARAAGGAVEIAVRDNGIGIPWDERRDLFDEFVRGRQAIERGTAGVGLGLAVVRAIVRAHHGKIHLTSRPDHGSTFVLRLPVGRPRAST
jgi:two-component system, OmpR family, phosphate regulon sensor histidine kinase PhoR